MIRSCRSLCGSGFLHVTQRSPLFHPVRLTRGSARKNHQSQPSGLQHRLILLVKPALLTATVGGVTYYARDLFPRETVSEQLIRKMNSYVKLTEDPSGWWKGRTLTEKILLSMVLVNFGVFLAWNLSAPVIQTFLGRYFLADVYGPAPCISMLGCMFSHANVIHIWANMYVLMSLAHSFPDAGHFFQLYMTGGMVAGLGSYLKAVVKPALASKSLGASGAILCLLGYAMKNNPDARFSLILVDQIYPHSFSANQAFNVVLALDVFGLVFGWRLFDHAAHLSGLLYGAFEGWRKNLQKKV